MNRIFTSIQKLRFGHPIMKTISEIYLEHKNIYLYSKLEDKTKIEEFKQKIEVFLEIKDLDFRYSNKKTFFQTKFINKTK